MKRIRAFRVEDDLWFSAVEKSEREGTTVSQVIRIALKRYLQAGRKGGQK